MLVACVLCWMAAAAVASARAPAAPQRPPVPAGGDAAAAAPALRALADHLLHRCNGSVARAQAELDAAAAGADEPAARYALLRQAVAVAERRGHAVAALAAIDRLAAAFELDGDAEAVALLRRMGEGDAAARVGAALAGLHRAAEHIGHVDGPLPRGYRDAAVRAAALCDHPRVYDHVAARGDELQRLRELARASPSEAGAADRATLARALAAGDPLPPLPVAVLTPWCTLPANTPSTLDACNPPTLAALADAAHEPALATALRRAALAAAGGWFDTLTGDERRAAAALVVDWTRRTATSGGVQALRFRADADLAQLAIANGAWRVADGLLEGSCTGTHNFATHRLAFRAVRSVVIRGGIRSAEGLNFRCKVGDVNLLLNWEVQPQNHLWVDGNCTPTTPPLLRAGVEHCLLFVQAAHGVQVLVDGELAWIAPGASLAGTITVYPALGSAIFVREILVDGEPEALVDAPAGDPK